MDTVGDDRIHFDAEGICNYCHEYDRLHTLLVPPPQEAARLLAEKTAEIKAAGKDAPYDCILGLSGGVESSYLGYL